MRLKNKLEQCIAMRTLVFTKQIEMLKEEIEVLTTESLKLKTERDEALSQIEAGETKIAML